MGKGTSVRENRVTFVHAQPCRLGCGPFLVVLLAAISSQDFGRVNRPGHKL